METFHIFKYTQAIHMEKLNIEIQALLQTSSDWLISCL